MEKKEDTVIYKKIIKNRGAIYPGSDWVQLKSSSSKAKK
jgi:hypothetical protein